MHEMLKIRTGAPHKGDPHEARLHFVWPRRSRDWILVYRWGKSRISVELKGPKANCHGSVMIQGSLERDMDLVLEEWLQATKASAGTPEDRLTAKANVLGHGAILAKGYMPPKVRQAIATVIPPKTRLLVLEKGIPERQRMPIELMGTDESLWATTFALARPEAPVSGTEMSQNQLPPGNWSHVVGDRTFRDGREREFLRNMPERVQNTVGKSRSLGLCRIVKPRKGFWTAVDVQESAKSSVILTVHAHTKSASTDQGRPCLVLSSGYAGQLEPLLLRGRSSSLKLAALNVCSSGQPEWFGGLDQGFVACLLEGGCSTVVATLAKVESRQASDGLEDLLGIWGDGKLDISQAALRARQRAWEAGSLSPLLCAVFGDGRLIA